MLLNHFFAMMKGEMQETGDGQTAVIVCKDIYGSNRNWYWGNTSGAKLFYTNTVGIATSYADNVRNWKVRIGTDDTPVTKEDYALGADLGASLRTGTTWLVRVGNQVKNVCTTYLNSTDADIVVKEVGLSIGVYNSSNDREVLYARKVLDTPVTMHPGEQYTFTYIIEMIF